VDETHDRHVPAAGDPQHQRVNQAGDGPDQPPGAWPEAKGVPGGEGRCRWTCCGSGPAVWGWLEGGGSGLVSRASWTFVTAGCSSLFMTRTSAARGM
jgi:hypothetical protein